MRKFFILIPIILSGCGISQSDYNKLVSENESLSERISELDSTIQSLRDSVSILSYPAEQRFNHILELIKNKEYDKAKEDIAELKNIFPLSNESSKCDEQSDIINKKIAEEKEEEEKIKAEGFKVFKDNAIINIDKVTYKYSGFNYGKKFIFDYCNDVDRYTYRTAHKTSTYILASLNISTKENYARKPEIVVYKIKDGMLKGIADFTIEYATWSSYGASIGNYNDDSHDFSKVNSINYSMAAEISLEESKQPLFILVSKNNYLNWSLPIEEVNKNYIVVKVLNRNKL